MSFDSPFAPLIKNYDFHSLSFPNRHIKEHIQISNSSS